MTTSGVSQLGKTLHSSNLIKAKLEIYFNFFTFKRIKNFLNFVDDTSSSAQRSRHSTKMKTNTESRPTTPQPPSNEEIMTPRTLNKTLTERFSDCIYASNAVDLDKLRKLSWSGIPSELRPVVWKILIVKPQDRLTHYLLY